MIAAHHGKANCSAAEVLAGVCRTGRLDITGPIRVVHQLRRPTADEPLLDCPRVVGTEVGLSLVRVSPN
jgi:hypothetical protein